MDKVLHRNLQFNARRYVVDFLGSASPSHIVSGALSLVAAVIIGSMLPHKAATSGVAGTPIYSPRPDPTVIAQQVAMAHLFGQDMTAAAAAAPVSANISLEGVIYSDDNASTLAILKVDGDSDIFRVGDTLPDGERLRSIAPTAVQLGGAGATRVIELQEDFGDGGSGTLLAGMAGRSNPFPGMQMSSGLATYTPVLKPVELSQNLDPLSQLRSLRAQLIRQQVPAAAGHPAKIRSKP